MSSVGMVREFESVWGRMRETIAAQEELIAKLERENEQLRRQAEEYRLSLHAVLIGQSGELEAQLVAEADPSRRTGVTFEQLVQELEKSPDSPS